MEQDSTSKQRKVFITGGTGFLGLNIIDILIQEGGYQIFALHRKNSDVTELSQRQVTLCEGSITDVNSLMACFPADIDIVFHVAGDTHMWQGANHHQRLINVEGTRNMIDVAIYKNAQRFVYTSSVASYGLCSEIINEKTPSNALQSGINYYKTKFEAEQLVKQAVAAGKLSAVIVNPAVIMGPYDRGSWARLVIMLQKREVPFLPKGRVSIAHVKDIAKAHVSAAHHGIAGENYILGGTTCSYGQLIVTICDTLGCAAPRIVLHTFLYKLIGHIYGAISRITRKEPPMTPEVVAMLVNDTICDDEKAKRELGFMHQPITTIVEDCISWMQSANMV